MRRVEFFADGVAAAAETTGTQLTDLLRIQTELKAMVRAAGLRARNAVRLVDYALAQPIFTVPQGERHLGVTHARANALVGQLVAAGVLRQRGASTYGRHFAAPEVLAVLLR